MTEPAIDAATFDHLLDITGGDLEFVDELVDTYLADGADPGPGAARGGRRGRHRRRSCGRRTPSSRAAPTSGRCARRGVPGLEADARSRHRRRCRRTGDDHRRRLPRRATGCSRPAPNEPSPARGSSDWTAPTTAPTADDGSRQGAQRPRAGGAPGPDGRRPRPGPRASRPSSVRAPGSAPADRNSSTSSTSPLPAASWSGV